MGIRLARRNPGSRSGDPRLDHVAADARVREVAAAFLRAVRSSAPDQGALALAFLQGSPSAVENLLTAAPYELRLNQELVQALLPVYMAKRGGTSVPIAKMVAGPVSDAEAVSAARLEIGLLITQIQPEQLDAVRGYIVAAIQEGIPPARAARNVAALVGLTWQAIGRVVRYEKMLNAEGVEPETAARLVQAMTDRLLQQRGLLIARTETIAAETLGQQARWREAVNLGYLDPTTDGQEWLARLDRRTCALCRHLDHSVVPFGEPFPGGYLGPPAHPACRCSLGLGELPRQSFSLPVVIAKYYDVRNDIGEWSRTGGASGEEAAEQETSQLQQPNVADGVPNYALADLRDDVLAWLGEKGPVDPDDAQKIVDGITAYLAPAHGLRFDAATRTLYPLDEGATGAGIAYEVEPHGVPEGPMAAFDKASAEADTSEVSDLHHPGAASQTALARSLSASKLGMHYNVGTGKLQMLPPDHPLEKSPDFAKHVARIDTGQALAMGVNADTQSLYDKAKGHIGVYGPTRRKLQMQIVRDLVDGNPDVKAERKALIVGGLAGSGKSTWLENGAKSLGIEAKHYVRIDPDIVRERMAAKGMVPDYRPFGLAEPSEAGTLTHAEASHIADLAARHALAQGKNVIWDHSLRNKGALEEHLQMAEKAKGGPYETTLAYLEASKQLAAERSAKRYMDGGRYLPPHHILDVPMQHGLTENRNNYEAVKQHVDHAVLVQDGKIGELLHREPLVTIPSPAAVPHEDEKAGGTNWDKQALKDHILAQHPGMKIESLHLHNLGWHAAAHHFAGVGWTPAVHHGHADEPEPAPEAMPVKVPTVLPSDKLLGLIAEHQAEPKPPPGPSKPQNFADALVAGLPPAVQASASEYLHLKAEHYKHGSISGEELKMLLEDLLTTEAKAHHITLAEWESATAALHAASEPAVSNFEPVPDELGRVAPKAAVAGEGDTLPEGIGVGDYTATKTRVPLFPYAYHAVKDFGGSGPGYAATKWLQGLLGESKLPAVAKPAMSDYLGSGYDEMNNSIAAGKPTQRARTVQEGLSHSPLPESVRVYRGTSARWDLPEGTAFTFDRIVSTSASAKFAISWGGGHVTWVIDLPKGLGAFWGGYNSSEGEVTLPYNLKFEVLRTASVRQPNSGKMVRFVHLRPLHPDGTPMTPESLARTPGAGVPGKTEGHVAAGEAAAPALPAEGTGQAPAADPADLLPSVVGRVYPAQLKAATSKWAAKQIGAQQYASELKGLLQDAHASDAWDEPSESFDDSLLALKQWADAQKEASGAAKPAPPPKPAEAPAAKDPADLLPAAVDWTYHSQLEQAKAQWAAKQIGDQEYAEKLSHLLQNAYVSNDWDERSGSLDDLMAPLKQWAAAHEESPAATPKPAPPPAAPPPAAPSQGLSPAAQLASKLGMKQLINVFAVSDTKHPDEGSVLSFYRTAKAAAQAAAELGPGWQVYARDLKVADVVNLWAEHGGWGAVKATKSPFGTPLTAEELKLAAEGKIDPEAKPGTAAYKLWQAVLNGEVGIG